MFRSFCDDLSAVVAHERRKPSSRSYSASVPSDRMTASNGAAGVRLAGSRRLLGEALQACSCRASASAGAGRMGVRVREGRADRL